MNPLKTPRFASPDIFHSSCSLAVYHFHFSWKSQDLPLWALELLVKHWKIAPRHYVQTSTENEKESQFRAQAIHQSILTKKRAVATPQFWRCLRVSNNRSVRLSRGSTRGPPLLGSSEELPTWLLHCYMSGVGAICWTFVCHHKSNNKEFIYI